MATNETQGSLKLQQIRNSVLEQWKQYQTKNGMTLLAPYVSYSTAIEAADPEESSPEQYGLTWTEGIPHRQTIRAYISEDRILISDPFGPLFAQSYSIENLSTALDVLFTAIHERTHTSQ